MITGYAQALRDLGEGSHQGESPEHAADRFLDWLKRSDLSWLVVLDEVADPAAVDGLWPAGPSGRVLVTTAYPDAAAAAQNPRAAEVGCSALARRCPTCSRPPAWMPDSEPARSIWPPNSGSAQCPCATPQLS